MVLNSCHTRIAIFFFSYHMILWINGFSYCYCLKSFVFVGLHVAASLCEAMKKRRETPIVQDIGDVMLARVSEIIADIVLSLFPSSDLCCNL